MLLVVLDVVWVMRGRKALRQKGEMLLLLLLMMVVMMVMMIVVVVVRRWWGGVVKMLKRDGSNRRCGPQMMEEAANIRIAARMPPPAQTAPPPRLPLVIDRVCQRVVASIRQQLIATHSSAVLHRERRHTVGCVRCCKWV